MQSSRSQHVEKDNVHISAAQELKHPGFFSLRLSVLCFVFYIIALH